MTNRHRPAIALEMLFFRNKIVSSALALFLGSALGLLAQQSGSPQTFLNYQQQIQSGSRSPGEMGGVQSPGRIDAPVMSMQQWGQSRNTIDPRMHRDAGRQIDSQMIETAIVERRVIFSQKHDQARQMFLRADQEMRFADATASLADAPVRNVALGARRYADATGEVDFDKLNRNVFRRNRSTDPDSGEIPVQRAGGGADPQ
ncbi:MAG: hypothetical protein LAT55_02520 [Opitutales bacterium]|nr:hypothetical protein [Opitutales bacterium]